MKTVYELIEDLIPGLDVDEINEDTRLIEDLGLDSLGLMQLVLDIEDEYDISFDDANLLFDNFNKIGDLISIVEELREE